MWTVEVTAQVDEVYAKLDEAFKKDHVPQKEIGFTTTSRSGRTRDHTKMVNIPDELTARQFRYLSKSVQNALVLYKGKVTVNMIGDENSMSVRIEGNYA